MYMKVCLFVCMYVGRLESGLSLPAGELGIRFDSLAQVSLPLLLLHDPVVALEPGRPPDVREREEVGTGGEG